MNKQFIIPKSISNYSGIYAIVNNDKKKIYIGKSKNIRNRLQQHSTSLNKNKSPKAMQEDFNNGDLFEAHQLILFTYKSETFLLGMEEIFISYFINELGRENVYNAFATRSHTYSSGVAYVVNSCSEIQNVNSILGLHDAWMDHNEEDFFNLN